MNNVDCFVKKHSDSHNQTKCMWKLQNYLWPFFFFHVRGHIHDFSVYLFGIGVFSASYCDSIKSKWKKMRTTTMARKKNRFSTYKKSPTNWHKQKCGHIFLLCTIHTKEQAKVNFYFFFFSQTKRLHQSDWLIFALFYSIFCEFSIAIIVN